ncbi:hypothetical protein AALO_G00271200 [Alosa alosa]|uniref:Uncharacterized protein n=1 Tax=Alosa alosa TaxID=278164 RepID=A0AAV6FQG8_9TELE|nr:hypothetical protein AALO_G00271200 [Alosa alosa]
MFYVIRANYLVHLNYPKTDDHPLKRKEERRLFPCILYGTGILTGFCCTPNKPRCLALELLDTFWISLIVLDLDSPSSPSTSTCPFLLDCPLGYTPPYPCDCGRIWTLHFAQVGLNHFPFSFVFFSLLFS